MEGNALYSTLASFLVILLELVVIIYTARMFQRLTNNSAVVLCTCRRKFPDYKQKRQNCDRLNDFKVDLCPEQRIPPYTRSLRQQQSGVKAAVSDSATALPKADVQELGSD